MTWDIDPNIVHLIGPLALTWYGLFFAGGFFVGLNLMQWIYRREGRNVAELDSLLWYVLIGTAIGMRLVHCLFYEPERYLVRPWEIPMIWLGGYASHGGAIGVLSAVYLYCRPPKTVALGHTKSPSPLAGEGGTQGRMRGRDRGSTTRFDADDSVAVSPNRPGYLWLLDRLAIAAVIAGAFIRIGNFFKSEILGKPTDSIFGVVFKNVGPEKLHPVQLYEAVAYLVIFAVLLTIYRRRSLRTDGALAGLYFVLVFAARFGLEYFKAPQATYEAGFAVSVGQWLSVPFVVVGLILLFRRPAHLGVQQVGE